MSNDKTVSSVCQALFSNPKARSKARFGYLSAERMRNPLAGAYASAFVLPKAEVETQLLGC
ncbi:MAG: hypothetical protein LBK66_03780 [Spirochaetaceae bacterium]|nr:hypothetical protein [Spirochaetaceae bacterium]